MKIANDVYKFARRFEHARDLFVRDAHEAQRIKERRADEVVPVHLRPSDFVPHQDGRAVGAVGGDRTVNARCLVEAGRAIQCVSEATQFGKGCMVTSQKSDIRRMGSMRHFALGRGAP